MTLAQLRSDTRLDRARTERERRTIRLEIAIVILSLIVTNVLLAAI
jgi:hypothetical protein